MGAHSPSRACAARLHRAKAGVHMQRTRRSTGIAALTATLAALGVNGCGRSEPLPSPPATSASPSAAAPTERVVGPLSEADAQALATMNDGLKAYLEMHQKVE